jgi:hypothetical protein
VCVFETPRFAFSHPALRSRACLFCWSPCSQNTPPRARSGSIRDFSLDPWGRMTCPGPRERPALPPKPKPEPCSRSLLPAASPQASRPPPACPPPRRPGACDVAGFRWRGKGRVLFFSSGQKGLGPHRLLKLPLGCLAVRLSLGQNRAAPGSDCGCSSFYGGAKVGGEFARSGAAG